MALGTSRMVVAIMCVQALGLTGCALPDRWPAGWATGPGAFQDLTRELSSRQQTVLCLTTAEQLARDGHLREAILLYEKARQSDPRATDYPRRLAPLYAQTGDLVQAAAEFHTALAASPKDANLWNDAACLELRRGNLRQAESLLRQALEADPQHLHAHANLGLLLARQGRLAEAFELFQAALGPAAAHTNLAVVLAEQGQIDLAREAVARALACDPHLPQARALAERLPSAGTREPPPRR